MKLFSSISHLRDKINKVRKRIGASNPHQKWKLIHFCADKPLTLIGLNVLNDCTRNWRSPLGGIAAVGAFAIQAYSLWFYWHENKITALQSFAIFAMVAQV